MLQKKYLQATLAGLLVLIGSCGLVSGSPYATEVVGFSGSFGNTPYDSPESLLGKPATDFHDPWGSWSGGTNDRRVKLVEPAYNKDAAGNKLIITLNGGATVTVKFDHAVMDEPGNPFGIDFLVFGNAFYAGSGSSGFVNDSTDMSDYMIEGGVFSEAVTVSVSPDNINWYTYENGPFGDDYYPTQGYQWDQNLFDTAGNGWTDQEMDFTKPVDPLLQSTFFADGAISAAEMIAAYSSSGGGAGFDLAESGFENIQYIKVTGYGGEIDAFADVSVPEPTTLVILAVGSLGLLHRRKNIEEETC